MTASRPRRKAAWPAGVSAITHVDISGNTRDAHRLLQLAKIRGRQTDLMERLHRGYFSELPEQA